MQVDAGDLVKIVISAHTRSALEQIVDGRYGIVVETSVNQVDVMLDVRDVDERYWVFHKSVIKDGAMRYRVHIDQLAILVKRYDVLCNLKLA